MAAGDLISNFEQKFVSFDAFSMIFCKFHWQTNQNGQIQSENDIRCSFECVQFGGIEGL